MLRKTSLVGFFLYLFLSLIAKPTYACSSPEVEQNPPDPPGSPVMIFSVKGCAPWGDDSKPPEPHATVDIYYKQGSLNVLRFKDVLFTKWNLFGSRWSDIFRLYNPGEYIAKFKLGGVPIGEKEFFVDPNLVSNRGGAGIPEGPKAEEVLCDGNQGVATGLGCLHFINPTSLAASIAGTAVGVGGGIALILIAFASYIVMTSQGDPRRLQHGKELLAAALMGLFMMILSGYILRILGVNILGIF